MQTILIRPAGRDQSPERLAELRSLVGAANFMAMRDGDTPLVLIEVTEPPAH